MRNVRRTGDDGSMVLAMLVTMVSLGLSTLLASIVAASLVGARADVQSVRALDAAQAGLNIGVARVMKLRVAAIRSPGDCTLDGAAGGGRYRVTLGFYVSDPNTTVCGFDENVHRYARITAVGSDGHGGRTRTLVATYAFTLGAVRRPAGGRLVFNDATDRSCMNRLLRLAGCDPAAADQSFVYGADLTLAQVDTATLRADCVTVTAGAPAMQPCNPNDAAQRWTFNGRTFVAANTTSCLDSSGGQNAPVLLGTGVRCPASTGSTPTWQPDASVGAGYASSATSGEIVNGAGFARCLSTVATVVACGQSALTPGSTAPWLITPLAGTPYVTVASALTCLTTSPAGFAVSMRTCSPSDPTQRWKAPTLDTTWAASFRMQDVYGNCLTASTSLPDPYSAAAVVSQCSPSAAQKWNVDTTAFSPTLTNVEQR